MNIVRQKVMLVLAGLMVPVSFSCAAAKASAKGAENPIIHENSGNALMAKADSNAEAPTAASTGDVAELPPDVLFVQGLSDALNSGSLDDALALFDEMPGELADDEGLLTLKASLLLSAGRDKDAEALAADLLKKNPKSLDVLELNMMIAKKKDDKAKKTQLLKQMLAIDPKNAYANIELGGEQALKRSYKSARDYYYKAITSEPENTEALFGYGKMSYYLEKDKDAHIAFERILKVDPENAMALAYLGKLEGEARRYAAAKDYVLRAIASDPTNSDYFFDLGTYCRYLGDYAAAEKAWRQTTVLEPDYFLGYVYLAGICEEKERWGEALEYYRKVIEKNPEYYYAYESVGILAWREKSYDEARKAFEQALKTKPGDISYTLMVAACYLKLKDTYNCKKFTEAAMKGMDRNSTEYMLVRMFHDMAGDAPVGIKIQSEESRNKKGKYLFYYALFYELKGNTDLARKYYITVVEMKSPMFFEYRMAEWAQYGEMK